MATRCLPCFIHDPKLRGTDSVTSKVYKVYRSFWGSNWCYIRQYCKVLVLFCRERRKWPIAAHKCSAGSQVSASSSLAEAGNVAAVSTVHDGWHNDNLKHLLVHLGQMSWGLNVLYRRVSSYCAALMASSEIDFSLESTLCLCLLGVSAQL